MFTIVCARGQESAEFEFDREEDDFEVLRFQILSLFDEINEDFVLIDFAGRELKTVEDLDELDVTTNKKSAFKSSTGDKEGEEAPRLYVWLVDMPFHEIFHSTCSAVTFPGEKEGESLIQPRFRIIDTPFDLCMRCMKHVSPGLLQAPNSTMMLLQPFQCKGKEACDFGLTLGSYDQQSVVAEEKTKNKQVNLDSPVGKYLRWNYFQAAVDSQSLYSQGSMSGIMSEGERQMDGRLRSGVKTVQAYEDLEQQRKARECIDFERVCERAAAIAQSHPSSAQAEDVLCLRALLEWFKHDFFKWFKKPNCPTPGCPGFSAIGGILPCGSAPPSAEEQQRDWAGRVELYRCQDCQTLIRFPRINNPSRLLETRVGRCGEFANAFCLVCRSLGLDAHWVLDFTDHVWVEIYVPSLGRYAHADPCEKSLDAPLTYEAGWNKKLSYIFSFSRFGVTDVIHRYSRKFSSSVCHNRTLCSEKFVQHRVKALDQQAQQWFSHRLTTQTGVGEGRGALTLARFQQGHTAFAPSYYTNLQLASELSMSGLLQRKANALKDLQMLMFLPVSQAQCSPEELMGRISGDQAWKQSRGEAGTAASSGGGVQVEGMEWLRKGIIFASGNASTAGSLEIFVSSVGNDDTIDNPGNQFSSDVPLQHARLLDTMQVLDRVMSPYRICVGGAPVLPRPGRGHNVTLLCAHTGAFLWSQSFDTWGSDSAGAELVVALQPYLFPLSGGRQNRQNEVSVKERGNRPGEQREVYVLVVTVLDSGENGGSALQQCVEDLLAPRAAGRSRMGAKAVAGGIPPALPGHRESWVMVAYIGEQYGMGDEDEDCSDCSGTLQDMDCNIATISVKEGNNNDACKRAVASSICPVREVLHCATAPRHQGPTMARLQVPLLPRQVVKLTGSHIDTDTHDNIDAGVHRQVSPSQNHHSTVHGSTINTAGLYCQEIDMYVPAAVTQCVLSQKEESYAAFVARVEKLSVTGPACLSGGFVVTSPSLMPAISSSSGTAAAPDVGTSCAASSAGADTRGGDEGGLTAYLFDATGFPLQRLQTATAPANSAAPQKCSRIFVKSLPLGEEDDFRQVLPSSSGQEGCDGGCLQYISLGGAHHPDTISFDTTVGLLPSPGLGSEDFSGVLLDQVRFTGDDIVESIRCKYVYAFSSDSGGPRQLGVKSWSPQIGSAAPCPKVEKEGGGTDAPPLRSITSVSIRHGDLVDSITLNYSNGEVVRAGGGGGGTTRTVAVDVAGGERVIGFFGGIGGHIHHFGVILFSHHQRRRRHADVCSKRGDGGTREEGENALLGELCGLATSHQLWNHRLASLQQQLLLPRGESSLSSCPHSRIYMNQHYCAGTLLRSIMALQKRNETALFRKCIQTTILYTTNIIKNIDNPKFHCIKLSNKNFQNFVLSLEGGLTFFVCSPVPWIVCFHSDCLMCSAMLLQVMQNSGDEASLAARSLWVESLSSYCMFLSAILRLDQFQNM